MPNQKRWSKLLNADDLAIGQKFYSAHRVDGGWQSALYQLTERREWEFVKLADAQTYHKKLRVSEERGLTLAKSTQLKYVSYKKGPLWKQEQLTAQHNINERLIAQSIENEKIWNIWKDTYASNCSEVQAVRLAVFYLRDWANKDLKKLQKLKAQKLARLTKESTGKAVATRSASSLGGIQGIDFDTLCRVVKQQVETLEAGEVWTEEESLWNDEIDFSALEQET